MTQVRGELFVETADFKIVPSGSAVSVLVELDEAISPTIRRALRAWDWAGGVLDDIVETETEFLERIAAGDGLAITVYFSAETEQSIYAWRDEMKAKLTNYGIGFKAITAEAITETGRVVGSAVGSGIEGAADEIGGVNLVGGAVGVAFVLAVVAFAYSKGS